MEIKLVCGDVSASSKSSLLSTAYRPVAMKTEPGLPTVADAPTELAEPPLLCLRDLSFQNLLSGCDMTIAPVGSAGEDGSIFVVWNGSHPGLYYSWYVFPRSLSHTKNAQIFVGVTPRTPCSSPPAATAHVVATRRWRRRVSRTMLAPLFSKASPFPAPFRRPTTSYPLAALLRMKLLPRLSLHLLAVQEKNDHYRRRHHPHPHH